ncbi:hypothetical protein [Demequina silvatica]|uniref:hypothetical protein n=1 Tax=Demequina silvatica TaxID=1638988 RepID=UPI0007833DE3|nr:hypothetical protein [Demequina silvatica]
MSTATAPIKVSAESDTRISHAAHFLGMPKKDLVERAVVEYIENHRDEIDAAVARALRELDGTRADRVALLAGISREELDAVGGLAERD